VCIVNQHHVMTVGSGHSPHGQSIGDVFQQGRKEKEKGREWILLSRGKWWEELESGGGE
jgi:hypothetical protein